MLKVHNGVETDAVYVEKGSLLSFLPHLVVPLAQFLHLTSIPSTRTLKLESGPGIKYNDILDCQNAMMEFLDQAGLKVPLPQEALPREKTEQELWNPPPYEREEPIYKIAYKMFYPGEDERGDDGRKVQREDEYDEEGNIIPREGGSLHAVKY